MLINEYHEFAAKIDQLNEDGSVYDASLKGVEILSTPVTRSMFYIYTEKVSTFRKMNTDLSV